MADIEKKKKEQEGSLKDNAYEAELSKGIQRIGLIRA
jgi:hypothetical protein